MTTKGCHEEYTETDGGLSNTSLSDSEEEVSLCIQEVLGLFNRNVSAPDLASNAESIYTDFNELLTHNSPITMLPNYNISPTGDEYGDYLVIDVGGSTLRVAVVTIDKPAGCLSDRSDRVKLIIEKKWNIENSFKTIDLDFFKWIGERICETLQQQSLLNTSTIIDTGITWSFPLETTSHNNGTINFVSKGWTIADDVYNKDLKQILESTMKTHFNVDIDIHVVVNDSLAVYAAGTFLDKYTKLALVLGTGLNLCCSLKSKGFHADKQLEDAVLLNVEMSLFGRLLVAANANRFDHIIDERFKGVEFKPHLTADPRTKTLFQPTELMTSGRYLPELTRLILVELIDQNELFSHPSFDHSLLHHVYSGFSGELMCFVSELDDIDAIKGKLQSAYGWDHQLITKNDVVLLKQIVRSIIKRAAFVVAVTVVGLVKLIHEHDPSQLLDTKLFKVGFVGSVLLYFHSYRDAILDYINNNEEIKALNIHVEFKLVDNSSIVGAAIGAAYYKVRQ